MIFDTIKAESIRLRKERNPLGAFATTVLAKAQELQKGAIKEGVVPDMNDDFALRAIRYFVKVAEENITLKAGQAGTDATDQAELTLLNSWLPQMVSEADLRAAVLEEVGKLPEKNRKGMGIVMKALKDQFGVSMDPAMASKLTQEALN
jgi:uncharacterized protein YqeY